MKLEEHKIRGRTGTESRVGAQDMQATYSHRLLLTPRLSGDVAGSQSVTYRDELAYQPPTCIHHLAFLRLGCLWGKVSHEGHRVCVWIIGTRAGLIETERANSQEFYS